jgi:hypothetical protein
VRQTFNSCTLCCEAFNILADAARGSEERRNALALLEAIERELAARDLSK